MPDEKSAGAAYLAALRRSTPQAAGAAPARAPEGDDPASSYPFEKRRSPRYRCQGSARLKEVGSEVATWATFTDISLHGCYVEAMSTFRVGTALALTIEVNGYRVECGGTVRVVYPNLGMGISFTSMAEEHRGRLRDLLHSLSRPSVILGARVGAQEPVAAPKTESAPAITNPGAALQAITNFFEERHLLSREEFFRILRKSQ